MQKVYYETIPHAREHGEMELYKESTRLNEECTADMVAAVNTHKTPAGHPGGAYYDFESALNEVTNKYGTERVNIIVADYINHYDYDGRLSKANKDWAKTVEIPKKVDERYVLGNLDGVHMSVLDGFVNHVRKADENSRENVPTFLDFLRSKGEYGDSLFNGDVIVGDVEMNHSLVWNYGADITDYCYERYADLLNSPYQIHKDIQQTQEPPVPLAEKLYERTVKGKTTDHYLFYQPNGIDSAAWLTHDTLKLITEKADKYVICADALALAKEEMERYNIEFCKMPRDWHKLSETVKNAIREIKPEYEKQWRESKHFDFSLAAWEKIISLRNQNGYHIAVENKDVKALCAALKKQNIEPIHAEGYTDSLVFFTMNRKEAVIYADVMTTLEIENQFGKTEAELQAMFDISKDSQAIGESQKINQNLMETNYEKSIGF